VHLLRAIGFDYFSLLGHIYHGVTGQSMVASNSGIGEASTMTITEGWKVV